ncbi:MAG: FAD-dependent oxidoreductase, partial [Gaiellaceae bacterium]
MSTEAATRTSFAELHLPLAPPEAVVEAERCLDCGGPYAPAPCSVACPAGIDVPSFVGALARNEPGEAAGTILAENLLGGTCARVCPVELLCEGACVLVHEGRPPIQIAALQRFATDWAFEEGILPRRVTATPTGKRVAVIGAGPAGMACAGELAALGHAVEVYDGREEVGGLVRFGIAPYRQQVDPLPEEARLVESLGVAFRLGEAIESPEALRRIEDDCDAVVLAVGLGADLEPELPGSELPGVWRSLEFIEALKTGRPPEVGARTVVIGG